MNAKNDRSLKQAAAMTRLSLPHKVILVTALGFLAGVLLSWPLWYVGARPLFPALPVIGSACKEASWLSGLTAGFLLLSITSVLIFPLKKTTLAGLLGALILLAGLDANRLQPWVWFYFLVFGAALFSRNDQDIRLTWRWLIAAVYVWSGFNKLSPYFAEDNFPWFVSAFSLTKALAYPALGYAVALLEMCLGVGLLWPRSRRIFRWVVLLFHLFIVLMLSPLGLKWNIVVIPWNLSLAALVWLVFAEKDAIRLPKNRGHQLILAAAGLAPGLNFAGWWPESFSWKLYSFTQPEATFYAAAGSFNRSIEQEAIWKELSFDKGRKLLLDDWAVRDLHTPMFASGHTFRQTAVYLCGCTTSPDSAGLYILTVQPWNKKGEQWQKIPCRTLLHLDQ